METVLSVVVGALFGTSVYLMLSRNLVKFIIGMTLIGNAANLMIFMSGGLVRGRPPLVPDGAEVPVGLVANPLPQALVLTAIVISFGLLAFALTLAYRAHEELGTVDTDAMRDGEPAPGELSSESPPDLSDADAAIAAATPSADSKPETELEGSSA